MSTRDRMTASTDARATSHEAAQRAPDFFIVGHHKSGTTALYEMLRRHPQIFMPDLKEPRYFAHDLRDQFEPVRSMQLPHTLEEYLALFDRAAPGEVTGEASPSYLRSGVAARAIAEVQPAARIIAILREPASFVRSLHLQLLQDRVETEQDLRKAVEAEELMRSGRRVRRYSDHVRYVEQLRRYEDAFGREQMLVLIYEDFRADNRAILETVLSFLGVDASVPIETLEANPAVRVRSPRLGRIVNGIYAGRGPVRGALKAAVKAIVPRSVQRGALQTLRRRLLYVKPPPPDTRFDLELRRRFKPEVVALSEYLGRDLITQWGYGDVR
jgi:hypothetical protein